MSAVVNRLGRVLGVLLLRRSLGKQLVQLENRLSDSEVAQFRWWTWATWHKRRWVSYPLTVPQLPPTPPMHAAELLLCALCSSQPAVSDGDTAGNCIKACNSCAQSVVAGNMGHVAVALACSMQMGACLWRHEKLHVPVMMLSRSEQLVGLQAPKSEALAGRLSAVYGIIGAQDLIKQKQSHTAHKSQVRMSL